MAFVDAGNDLIDMMAGGSLDTASRNWLNESAQYAATIVSDAGRALFEKAKSMYQMVNEADSLKFLRNLNSKKDNLWEENAIAFLGTLEKLQTAGPIMQRWIMANPEVRTRYLNQTLDGYSGSYNNVQGESVELSQYDYRRVIDGVVVIGEKSWGYKSVQEELPEGEKHLTIYEKKDIWNTWEMCQVFLEEDDDFTMIDDE